ncbi:hypothetical protein TL16_g11212 [Triparma laevis f. inornata]|uniref:Uncharacterized protein n=1 Tax=Triparma laevis f. inornata TaxID=1714386 RepID=A0A9W7ER90_9STRA|nr:hypothetical protein TL16_g11212 [Triparma laevis f. inornata]
MYTSGTTSAAKGVRLSSRAILYQASSSNSLLHNLSTNNQTSTSTSTSKKINSIVTIPTLLHSFPENKTFPSITFILTGGSHLTPGHLEKTTRIFPNAKVVQTYACTECASSITFIELTDQNHPNTNTNKPGKIVGKPFHMSLEVKIFHDGDPNQPLPPNSIGVIGTRGPQVMDGYVSFPNHDPREFFMTNDLGCLDSLGNLYFCGRNSDVVRSGAETILSAEVENTVSEKLQDVVSECAVFPYPDEKWGEVVAIVVVARSEHGGANSAVKNRINRGWNNWGLAKHKKPKQIFVAKALPKNSAGKVQKKLLSSMYIDIKSKL